MDDTLVGDCAALLSALAEKAQGREWGDARWDAQVRSAVAQAEQELREQCGVYAQLNDAIDKALPSDGIWCAILPFQAACGAAACCAPTVR